MIAATRRSALRTATPKAATLKVAAYCRQSVADDLEFNSLHAQRAAVEQFVLSQREKGWVASSEEYSDSGASGGNVERPALKRLLADIEAGRIGIVAVHRLDRLSRNLNDFVQLVAFFEKHDVAFVSTTQSFDTSTSMGRMVVNLLATFATFEREMIAERTKEKICASRRRGLWTGGMAPKGFVLRDGKIFPDATEAEQVREIFRTFLELKSVIGTVEALNSRGLRTRTGKPFDVASLRGLLRNPVYIGKLRLYDECFDGIHERIVDQETFDAAQATFQTAVHSDRRTRQGSSGGLLRGLLTCGTCGSSMSRHYAEKRSRRYAAYVCAQYTKRGASSCPGSRVPLAKIESFVVEKIRSIGRDPSLVAETLNAVKKQLEDQRPSLETELKKLAADSKRLGSERENILQAIAHGGAGVSALVGRLGEIEEAIAKSLERESTVRAELAKTESNAIDESDLRVALEEFDAVWTELFPAERARVLSQLIEEIRFNAADKSVEIVFRPAGVRMLGQKTQEVPE